MNGINGFNNSNLRFPSPADIGGQRLLKMGGSLTAYIKTGNPYDDHYYTGGKKKYRKKKKNDFPLKDIFKALFLTAGLIGTTACIFGKKINIKKLNIKIPKVSDLFSKIGNLFKKP